MAAGWQCSRQTNRGSGHCIQDKQGRRQVDWVLVGVGDLLRFPLVAEDRRMRGGWSRRGEEGAKILYCCCLSHFHPPLSHTFSFSHHLYPCCHTDTLFIPIHLHIYTLQRSILPYTLFKAFTHTAFMLVVLWCVCYTTYKHTGPWPCSLHSIEATPYNLELMLS